MNTDAGADAAAAAVVARRASRHLLLLLDFDGTLCPFAPDPDDVYPGDGVRGLLASLASADRTTVGIISGRRLPDLQARARIGAGIYLAGSHGLEIDGPGHGFIHPDAAAAAPAVRGIADVMAHALPGMPGVFLEDKVFSIALHYREAAPAVAAAAQARFMDAARGEVEAGRLRVLPGACVIELLPLIRWDKGRALDWIRERVEAGHGHAFTVYAGDDVTDEDAFRAVGPDGLAIAASDRASGAEFRVDGPEGVERFLRGLAAQIQ